MLTNNPYLYHPHPLCRAAAEDVRRAIGARPEWEREFAKGKMLGVLVLEDGNYLAAYSGIVNIEANDIFVPPIYDLNNPDDFYKEKEAIITEINKRIAAGEGNTEALKAERKQRSQALQLEIFRHFDFVNSRGEWKNIVGIFADAKRGLPPGGAGECAAPRLLQYAYAHGLKPVAMAEFWYGMSPRQEARVHGQFYPSCIEKCSPILRYMLGGEADDNAPRPSSELPEIIFEDEHIIILYKPAEVLSAPAKDTTLFNVEDWLHETHPEVRGPMLVHRLDQSTSGLMIAAKNASAFRTLQQGFLDHRIRKTYHAWVDGDVPSECGVINLPMCTNPDDRPRQVVDRQFGKMAITRYRVLKRETRENKSGESTCRTLLALYPFTGRTHQLRLHCASPFGLDHPIAGDRIYNFGLTEMRFAPSDRLCLRASEISFPHPVTKEILHFKL